LYTVLSNAAREVLMRTRPVALAALLALPVVLTNPGSAGAQAAPRLPRVGRGAPRAAPLPPEIPTVARALQYKRSRWLLEGYTMISTFQAQDVSGAGTSSFTGFGGGTRGGYRISDYVSGTADASLVSGGLVTAGTAEAGTRFSFMPRDQQLRPYVDVRGAFVYMRDVYALEQNGLGSGSFREYTEGGRYSRGFGTVIGTGFEYQLRPSFAISTGMSGMRARMNAYRFRTAAEVPAQSNYWMTSYRYVLGIKYNPTRLLTVLAQNVTNK
jgi:hypothetical protein